MIVRFFQTLIVRLRFYPFIVLMTSLTMIGCSGSNDVLPNSQKLISGDSTASHLCATVSSGDLNEYQSAVCLDRESCKDKTFRCEVSKTYLQDAIDQAAFLAQASNRPSHVQLSAGTHVLEDAKIVFGVASRTVYLRLPEGVYLDGNSSSSLQAPACQENCERIDAAIFVGPYSNRELGGGIRNLKFETEGATCGESKKAVPYAAIVGETSQSDKVIFENLEIQNFDTAFELGSLATWAADPAYAADLSDPNSRCHTSFGCIAKRAFFSGVDPYRTLKIQNNKICATQKGIGLIGNYVDIINNTISLGQSIDVQNVPIGFGISAAFAGNHHVRVLTNQIKGAEIGILTEGSFPLLYTTKLFQNYWNEILSGIRSANSESYANEFARNYPQAPIRNGHLDFQGRFTDYLRAAQVLLDLASEAAVDSSDEEVRFAGMPYELLIQGNEILNSVRGIALYRSRFIHVYENIIHARSDLDVSYRNTAIGLNHTSNSFLASNNILNYDVGIHLRGVPGTTSVEGASYNGIGVKFISATREFPELGNQIERVNLGILVSSAGGAEDETLAGYNIAIRKNRIRATGPRGCDLVGARSLNSDIDWFTDNDTGSEDQSCN